MKLKITRPKDIKDKENQEFDNMIRDRIWHSVTGRCTMPIDVTDSEDRKGRPMELHLFSDKNVIIRVEGGDFRVMNVQAKYMVTESGNTADVSLAKTFYGTLNLKNDVFDIN